MSDLIIHGGKPLSGTITPSGNKNSVLPILCATLLTDAPVTLRNVPNITDVEKLVTFFTDQGSAVAWNRATGTIKLDHSSFDAGKLNGALPFMLNAINNPAFQEKVAKAGQAFLTDPKSLTITLNPAQPVPFQEIMGSAMSAPQTLPDMLAIDVTANN